MRSLVAYECGAVGPGKDCGYENVYLKAITGFPMAMEGKSAACAHLSPLGNIAAATADTWSNESVQNIKLLGGMAPTISLEQLAYDCRLFNLAIDDGREKANMLRDWLVRSDARSTRRHTSSPPPPRSKSAKAIVAAPDAYTASKAAANHDQPASQRPQRRRTEISRPRTPLAGYYRWALADLPEKEGDFISQQMGLLASDKFIPAEYGL